MFFLSHIRSFLTIAWAGMLTMCVACSYSSASKQPSQPTPADAAATPAHNVDLLSVKTHGQLPSQIKDYEGFRVSFNKDNHTPNWVAWELLQSETTGANSRSDKFWTDTDIDGCPETSDYTRSGYDRGHMSPAADNKLTAEMMQQCFVLANICPQDHALNAGAWSTLEKKSRNWANRDSAIIIVAGPIYESTDNKRIGDIGVRVPSAFFKVILAPFGTEPQAIGFIYPNMAAPGDMFNYSMTVDQVEQITGLDFFHNLSDDIENKVESNLNLKYWRK